MFFFNSRKFSNEIENRIRTLPRFNHQNSIRRIPKSIFDLVVDKTLSISELHYTLEDLSAKTFVEPIIFEEWEEILIDKKQIIFYGPPGTGKTFIAIQFSKYLRNKYGGDYKIVQFHPSYNYEDFIEGIKPQLDSKRHINYEPSDGIFKEFCNEAKLEKSKKFILIIDEINRGNLPKIFGELMFSLEYRDFEKEVVLPYSKGNFTIPSNVWIVATMNSADRSIALVDYALRRRFYFIELMPQRSILEKYFDKNQPVDIEKERILDFFDKINETISDDNMGKYYQLGHSYFMITDKKLDKHRLKRIWNYGIRPMLEEYYFEDANRISKLEEDLEMLLKQSKDSLKKSENGKNSDTIIRT